MKTKQPFDNATLDQVAHLVAQGLGRKRISFQTGLGENATRRYINEARRLGLEKSRALDGSNFAKQEKVLPLPKEGDVKRYIIGTAQNNTKVHSGFQSLLQLAEHYDAEVLVTPITYNKSTYAKSVKDGTRQDSDDDKLWYDPAVQPYLCEPNTRFKLAPDLIFWADFDILPTATNPLSGLSSLGGLASGIFPHSKMAMESIPTHGKQNFKAQYTTGCVTQLNYIQRKAGQKAEFHHVHGALIVEVLPDGTWFVRQLNVDANGIVNDLMNIAHSGGVVHNTNSVSAITWFDIHNANMSEVTKETAWGEGGILDQLRPKHQFFHDLHDQGARNHHDYKNVHEAFRLFHQGADSVENEILNNADFLHLANRDFCQSVVVKSNHDEAFEKWVRETRYLDDVVNVRYGHECSTEYYRAIEQGRRDFDLLETMMLKAGSPKDTIFLQLDEPFIICNDIGCGQHGHVGVRGSRGTPASLSKGGVKLNTGHTHSAGIKDGVYTAGVSELDQGYNKGLGSESRSFIVTYENGKRQIITMKNGKYKA